MASNTFSTLDDALAEIRRLRDQVSELQREIARLTAPAADDAEPPGSASRATDAGPAGAAAPRYVATAPATSGLTVRSDHAAAVSQLEQLREAIARLREQRAQVSEQFRNLTRAARRDVRAHAAPSPPTSARSVANDAPAPAVPATPALATPPIVTEQTATVASTGATPADVMVVPEDAGRTSAAGSTPDLTFSGEPPRASARRRWLVAAVILAAAAIATWVLVDRTLRRSNGGVAERPAGQAGQPHPAAEAAAEEGAVAPSPGTTVPADTSGASAPKPSGEAGSSPRRAVQTAALHIRLEATREVWLRAVADGRQVAARLFKPGEALELQADSRALVRAGDAGAVRLTVNGVDRGPVGRDGAVLTRLFDAATESRKPRR